MKTVEEAFDAASFNHQKYEELRERYFMTQAATSGKIENVYGSIEYG